MDNQREETVSSIGHELRTLLALIFANVDILEMENGKSEWIDDIREECKRSNFLIEKLMDGSLSLDDSDGNIDVTDQINRMLRFFRPLGKERHITLVSDIQDGVRAKMDHSEAIAVLSALMGNAVKYCDPGGSLHVELKKTSGGFSLAIENSFSNIESFDAERIFNRHAPSEEEKSQGSHGIGLAIASKIAQENGGRLRAKANKDKKTVTFILEL